jgi:hypothetical protein
MAWHDTVPPAFVFEANASIFFGPSRRLNDSIQWKLHIGKDFHVIFESRNRVLNQTRKGVTAESSILSRSELGLSELCVDSGGCAQIPNGRNYLSKAASTTSICPGYALQPPQPEHRRP